MEAFRPGATGREALKRFSARSVIEVIIARFNFSVPECLGLDDDGGGLAGSPCLICVCICIFMCIYVPRRDDVITDTCVLTYIRAPDAIVDRCEIKLRAGAVGVGVVARSTRYQSLFFTLKIVTDVTAERCYIRHCT